MAISDDDLVRQLEAVPLVEPPEMKAAILAKLKTPHPAFGHPLPALRGEGSRAEIPLPLAGEGGAKRRVRGVVFGLAWAAAILIVITVVIQRQSLPWQHASAT